MAMQTISKKSNKKGGPYTKNQQEKRKNEVYRLHFELGYPAQKIAEILKVNRNTVNSDISFCYSQLAEDWEHQNVKKLIVKQLERFELQRSRLHEERENCTTLSEKLSVEKLILDVDQKISQIASKLFFNNKGDFSITEKHFETDEEKIEKVTISLVKKAKSEKKSWWYTPDEIIKEFVKRVKCDTNDAEILFDEMIGLGLCYYYNGDEDNEKYDVLEFSKMRGYTTNS